MAYKGKANRKKANFNSFELTFLNNNKEETMKKTTIPKNRAQQHKELKKQIEERHPGIKEVIEVYNQWEEAHKAEQAHQAIKNSAYKITYSNSSNPKSFL